jgi:hypothetical protein
MWSRIPDGPRAAHRSLWTGPVTTSQSGTSVSLKCRAKTVFPFPMKTSLAPAASISFLMPRNCAACSLQNSHP